MGAKVQAIERKWVRSQMKRGDACRCKHAVDPGTQDQDCSMTKDTTNYEGGEGQFLSLQAPGPRRLGKRLVGFCG